MGQDKKVRVSAAADARMRHISRQRGWTYGRTLEKALELLGRAVDAEEAGGDVVEEVDGRRTVLLLE